MVELSKMSGFKVVTKRTEVMTSLRRNGHCGSDMYINNRKLRQVDRTVRGSHTSRNCCGWEWV